MSVVDDEHRRKRTKTSAACDACQRRKSRCDLVTEEGCYRCTILGTFCSFAPGSQASNGQKSFLSAPGPGGGDARKPTLLLPGSGGGGLSVEVKSGPPCSQGSPPSISRQEELLSTIDSRTTRLESMIASLSSRSRSFSRSTPVVPPRPLSGEAGSSNHPQSVSMWNTVAYDPGVNSMEVLQDPVHLGIASLGDVSAAFEQFNHAFQNILPPHPSPPIPPSTPFLRCCILHFTSHAHPPRSLFSPQQSKNILILTRQNMSQLPYCKPHIDIVKGLLALSYIPPDARHASLSLVDRLQAAGVAVEMGRALGMDEALEVLQRYPAREWGEEGLREVVDRAYWWLCAIHRVNWVQTFTSPSFISSALRQPSFAQYCRDKNSFHSPVPWIRHFALEAELLDIKAPFTAAYRAVRVGEPYSPELVDALLEQFDTLHARLKSWRESVVASDISTASAHLISLSWFLAIAISAKVSRETRRFLPLPLGYDASFLPFLHVSRHVFHTSRSLIRHLTSVTPLPDYTQLPTFSLAMTLLAFESVERTRKVERSAGRPIGLHPEEPSSIQQTAQLEAHVVEMFPRLGETIRHMSSDDTDPGWEEHTKSEGVVKDRDLKAFMEHVGEEWPFVLNEDWFHSFADMGVPGGGAGGFEGYSSM